MSGCSTAAAASILCRGLRAGHGRANAAIGRSSGRRRIAATRRDTSAAIRGTEAHRKSQEAKRRYAATAIVTYVPSSLAAALLVRPWPRYRYYRHHRRYYGGSRSSSAGSSRQRFRCGVIRRSGHGGNACPNPAVSQPDSWRAALPLQANAAERHDGVTNAQSTEVSAQRYWRGRHYGYRYYGPRRYCGPRYGYYGYRLSATAMAIRTAITGRASAFGIGPFGFRVF